MQHDEVIWQIIRHNHCSFMSKIVTGNFCRNPYNLTGVCNRSSCPLANSRYATIRDHEDATLKVITQRLSRRSFYLYMKTIERAHKPNELWERIKLPKNYAKALEIIDQQLMHWPKFLVHKTKQRLTKMTQYRIRMRKLELKVREKIMTVPRKEKKREARREEKAEKAAILEKSIENELLERLKRGVYGDIYNYPVKSYNKVLEMEGLQATEEEEEEEEEEPEIEYVEGYDNLEEEEDMEDFGAAAVDESLMGDSGSDGDDDERGETSVKSLQRRSRSGVGKLELEDVKAKLKKKARVQVEVEHEEADGRQKILQ